MKEVILLLAVVGVFIYGFVMVKKLDDFLEVNQKYETDMSETKEPSCVMLTGDLSEEEMIREIRQFCSNRSEVKVFLCDAKDTENVI